MRLHLDIEASLKATGRQNACGATKISEDLDRYEAVIKATRPDVLIECGTWLGGSARWFADRIARVITIDIDHTGIGTLAQPGYIMPITGDSANPTTAALAAALAGDGRVMVVLDSDHRTEHVRREIALYGPLVSPGCYLVVEDGIARWMNEAYPGNPLDAIEQELDGNDEWERDEDIEAMHPVSMHPAGWWIRKASE